MNGRVVASKGINGGFFVSSRYCNKEPSVPCPASVAKCRESWVVGWGRGCGSWVWVWVNVVGKIRFSEKKKNQKAKSCKIHETKISAYMSVLLPFPAVSKANKRILTFCVITLCVRIVITICVERLLHFALKILLHFASMLLHFALVLHFAAILITFCGDYYILRRNIGIFLSPKYFSSVRIS